MEPLYGYSSEKHNLPRVAKRLISMLDIVFSTHSSVYLVLI